jgi:lipoprotein signal peptidase
VLRIGPLHTGIFNVADAIVMSGMGLLAFALWRQSGSTDGKAPQGVKAE